MKPRRQIIAPYIGEFGWEVMNWQARLRWMIERRNAESWVIVAPPDRRSLFIDLLSKDNRIVFCPCRTPAMPGHASEDYRVDENGQRINQDQLRQSLIQFTRAACRQAGLSIDDAEIVTPPLDGTLFPTRPAHQTFVSFRRDVPVDTDVLLIPRSRAVATERNQPQDWWEALTVRLTDRGFKVAVMQTRLDLAIEQLSVARLAVGASTGGLHLASLCECPHYVWGPGDDQRWTAQRISNRQRYETVWNPLGTACRYDALGWQPDVATVAAGVMTTLDKLAKPATATAPVGRWRWRARRMLAKAIEPAPHEMPLPWRVREYARMHLI